MVVGENIWKVVCIAEIIEVLTLNEDAQFRNLAPKGRQAGKH